MAAGAPRLTFRNFPPDLKRFLRSLPPLPIPEPPALRELIARPVRTQWYERVENGRQTGRARLEAECRALTEYQAKVALFVEGASRSVVLRGAIMDRMIRHRDETWVLDYSYIAWVPPDYPVRFPLLFFRWERRTVVGPNAGPPYSVRVNQPYVPPRPHHYLDGHACLCTDDATAMQDGRRGWDWRHHDLRVILAWAGRYLNNYEYYTHVRPSWPDDER